MKTEIETRRVTIGDIATALGTTKATVSYALNGKGRMSAATREAVVEMARQMGFRPNPHAQRLTLGRCHDTIALFALTFDLGVTTRKLQLLQHALTTHGFRSPVHVCGTALTSAQAEAYQAEAMNNLRLQKPLGIICNIAHLSDETLRELDVYRREGGLVVCYDFNTDLDCDRVVFDREENTYTATRFLLEKGHRHIAFYGGWRKPHAERIAGFTRALEEFGAPSHPDWVLFAAGNGALPDGVERSSEEIGMALIVPFLSLRPRPTAICIADDVVAAAFIAEALRRGIRVPEEISVIGQDNLPLAGTISAVPLTTVSQPLEAIAETVLEFMMERVEGNWKGAARHRILHGELIERNSVADVHC